MASGGAGAKAGRMRIGEVAARLGVASSALRFYEDEGLIVPVRSEKGGRLYSTEDLERLAVVRALAEAGFPLETIGALARTRAASLTGDEAGRKVHDLLSGLRDEAERRLAEYRALIRQIDAAETAVRECFGCPAPPTPTGCAGCPVAGRLRDCALMKLVWEPER